MEIISSLLSNNTIEGIAEVDDKFFSQCYKGFKKMSREKKAKLRGISKDLICTTTFVSLTNRNVLSKVMGYGPNSIERMHRNFDNKVDKISKLFSDEELSYRKFASENCIKLIQTNSKVVKERNLLKDINCLHNLLAEMFKRTRGVNSYYLNRYIQFES
jgi:hypothetical protein